MQRFWIYIYIASFALITWCGYTGMQPSHTEGTNADPVFIGISFLIGLGFPSMAIKYAVRRAKRTNSPLPFKRPSFDSLARGWWSDPLPSIRICWLGAGFTSIGALFGLLHTDEKGVMLFLWQLALTLGFFLGERIAYSVFREYIAEE